MGTKGSGRRTHREEKEGKGRKMADVSRRAFLKTSGAVLGLSATGAGVLGLAGCAAASKDAPSEGVGSDAGKAGEESLKVKLCACSPTGNTLAAGLVLVLSLVTCGIYGLYWMYQTGRRVDRLNARYGRHTDNSGLLYLIIGILGLSIVVYGVAQNELNQYYRNFPPYYDYQ